MIEKKHKKGDIREDGKIYWSRSKDSPTGEVWLSPEKYYKRHSKNNRCAKKWRDKNLEKSRCSSRNWKEKNKDIVLEKIKNWRKNNKEYRNNWAKIYSKTRRLNDPVYKLSVTIRNLISGSIKKLGYKKNSRTFVILGCSYEDFKSHIEKQFKLGMTWENHGKWHLDHILPVASAITEEDILKLNHYTNFQPLWAEENIRKGKKLPATK